LTDPHPRLTTPFGFRSTAREVLAGVRLDGKRALVTGAGSGIGVETARALALAGAEVTLAVRDVEAGRQVAAAIAAEASAARPRLVHLELTDRGSIAALAAGWEGPLHVLVNNAGVMACPETRTPEGWELQLATNHLGHFALTLALHAALVRAGGARIVSVSSSAHQVSPVVFEDLHFRSRPYDRWAAYAQSKTANVLFAVEATRRWASDGILTNSLMPGAIPTRLQRHVGGTRTPPQLLKTAEQGAATSVLLAASPLLEGVGGRYFADCNEALPVRDPSDRDMTRVAPWALDPASGERLWKVSTELLA
jgi:NAD(P)-dependent dehydrogenase (short-subunit alcohol dehydrogenase family)